MSLQTVFRVGLATAALMLACAAMAEARCRDRELDALQSARTLALEILAERPADANAIAADAAVRIRSCARGESDPTEAAKLERFAIDTDVVTARALLELGRPADSAQVYRNDIASLERIRRNERVDKAVRDDAVRYAERLRSALVSAERSAQ